MVAVWIGNLTMTTFQKHLSFGRNKDGVDTRNFFKYALVHYSLFQYYDV